MTKRKLLNLLLCCSASFSFAADYEVTITNITPGQTFTPQLILSYKKNSDGQLFNLGEPASEALATLAESGNPQPLIDQTIDEVKDAQVNGALLGPGESVTVTIDGYPSKGYISIAAMLIPTNDTFVALNRGRLPKYGSKTFSLAAYDAGSEYNDQNCLNIPGPRCGGAALSEPNEETDEGYVHIGNGFHDLGDMDDAGNEILKPKLYDWRNSVATVTVKRVRH